jgi:hypothetical protein
LLLNFEHNWWLAVPLQHLPLGDLSQGETHQGIAEQTPSSPSSDADITGGWRGVQSLPEILTRLVHGIWANRFMLRRRLYLSKSVRSIRHSQHLRYATKYSISVALLSLPAFLPAGSTGVKILYYEVHLV